MRPSEGTSGRERADALNMAENGVDISQIREYDHLPQAARDYINLIEETLEVPVTYISVGPARESIIRKQA